MTLYNNTEHKHGLWQKKTIFNVKHDEKYSNK
jgi:hypothetical protein